MITKSTKWSSKMPSQDLQDIIDTTDIREFKLMDGTTIITEIVDRTDGKFLVSDPMQLTMDIDKGMIMFPWFFSADENMCEIREHQILASANVHNSVKVTYMKHLLKMSVLEVDDNGENEFLLDDTRMSDSDSIH